MTDPAGVDIVIVSHNTRDDLVACLRSVAEHPPTALGTIYVVDNASTDGSVEAARRACRTATIIPLASNVGFGAANNVALRRARSPLVLLLNSDAMVRPGAIDSLVARLLATGAAAAGPRIVDAGGRPEISFGPMLSPWNELRQAWWQRQAAASSPAARARVARHLSRERPVDWVTGACLLVRREAATAAGLFDERFFLYEEDVDLCAALRARGGTVLFTPEAEVVHRRGRSSAGTTSRVHYDRSHLAFYRKHAPAWAPLLQLWLRVRGRNVR